MGKNLCRSRDNRVIAGVCGGIAEYFATDPTIIRLVWAAFALTGTGVIVYIIAAIIMPERNQSSFDRFDDYDPEKDFKDYTSTEFKEERYGKPSGNNGRLILGAVLIFFGLLIFLQRFVSWIDFKLLWPLVFVVIGMLMIFKGGRRGI